MTRLQRAVVWLNTGDNSFNVLVLCMSPLITLCLIGMFGGGA